MGRRSAHRTVRGAMRLEDPAWGGRLHRGGFDARHGPFVDDRGPARGVDPRPRLASFAPRRDPRRSIVGRSTSASCRSAAGCRPVLTSRSAKMASTSGLTVRGLRRPQRRPRLCTAWTRANRVRNARREYRGDGFVAQSLSAKHVHVGFGRRAGFGEDDRLCGGSWSNRGRARLRGRGSRRRVVAS